MDLNRRLVFGELKPTNNYDLWSNDDEYDGVVEDKVLFYNSNNPLKKYKHLRDFNISIEELKEVFFEKE